MTKREFYIFKTILFALLTVSIYYYTDFIEKYGIKIFGEPIPFIAFVIFSFLILVILHFLFSKRPLTIEEIEEEEKREEEEELKEEWESLKDTLPLLEITLSTNEKIKGKFLEKNEYFENIENSSRYYKTFIVKIENVKK